MRVYMAAHCWSHTDVSLADCWASQTVNQVAGTRGAFLPLPSIRLSSPPGRRRCIHLVGCAHCPLHYTILYICAVCVCAGSFHKWITFIQCLITLPRWQSAYAHITSTILMRTKLSPSLAAIGQGLLSAQQERVVPVLCGYICAFSPITRAIGFIGIPYAIYTARIPLVCSLYWW